MHLTQKRQMLLRISAPVLFRDFREEPSPTFVHDSLDTVLL